jgi:hypothetical protein
MGSVPCLHVQLSINKPVLSVGPFDRSSSPTNPSLGKPSVKTYALCRLIILKSSTIKVQPCVLSDNAFYCPNKICDKVSI